MASWVVIELDTTAPAVEFGTVSAAEAGQLFQAAYTLDEPELTRARLIPGEGSAVELEIHADRVEAVLPPSIVGGTAELRLETEDEVGNVGVHSLNVSVTSPIGPTIRPVQPSAPPRGTAPVPGPDEAPRVVSSRWRRPSSSTSITSSSTRLVRSRLRLQSRASIDRSSSVSSAWSRWSSSSSTRAARYVEIAVRPSTRTSAGPRREGPEEEAILFGLW
jgi:hypothetical protein